MNNAILVPSEHLNGDVMVLKGPWQPENGKFFEEGKAIGIRLSASMGWKAEDLVFLIDIPNLKSVEIFHQQVKDISVLSSLRDLQHIGLETPFKRFDFSGFESLSVALVKWRPGCETLFTIPTLKYLNIDEFPYEDLEALKVLTQLSRLSLKSKKLESLQGIEHLTALTTLELFKCAALENTCSLASAPQLNVIQFHTCKKLENIDFISVCKNLKILHVENESGGKLDSVQFLRNCQELEKLFLIGIYVKDGDLSPILELKKLRALATANYKHHKPSREELKSKLSI